MRSIINFDENHENKFDVSYEGNDDVTYEENCYKIFDDIIMMKIMMRHFLKIL